MMDQPKEKLIIKEKSSLTWLRNLIIIFLLVFLIYKVFPLIQNIVIFFAIVFLFSYLLEPMVARIENKGISRIWSILIIYVVIVFIFYLIGRFVIPYIISEVADLINSLESRKIESTYQNSDVPKVTFAHSTAIFIFPVLYHDSFYCIFPS